MTARLLHGTKQPASLAGCSWHILWMLLFAATTTVALQTPLGRNHRSGRGTPRGVSYSQQPLILNDGLQRQQQHQATALSLSSVDDHDGDSPRPKKKRKVKTKKKVSAKTSVTAKAKTKTKTKKTASKKKKSVKVKKVQDEGDEEEPVPMTVTRTPMDPVEAVEMNLAKEIKQGEKDDDHDNTNNTYNGVWYGPLAKVPDILDFDVTGGRPGAIIESEADLERKEKMMQEMEDGTRKHPKWLEDYGFLAEYEDAPYDNDDPEAIDAATLGKYDITDLNTKFDYEWDPETDPDPNLLENQIYDDVGRKNMYIKETPKDEEGIEIGYDPQYGPSNPIDERTKVGLRDSYVIDEATRDDEMVTPEFYPGDPEIGYNEEVIRYRKSLDIIETYQDEFLPEDMPVPRHVAKWYGYPEMMRYPQKNYTNNRYTKLEDLTNFDEMTPFRARQRAVELARANNAEWMPDGYSQAWHQEQRRPYEEYGTVVGTLRKGECDPELVEQIQPALKILGSCADLLSIENDGTVFRFHYHGLIKNRYGMSCWTETLIRDCGVEVTGVIFETGFRARDPAYDGGFPYYGWE